LQDSASGKHATGRDLVELWVNEEYNSSEDSSFSVSGDEGAELCDCFLYDGEVTSSDDQSDIDEKIPETGEVRADPSHST
jgi:hypothetical protein